MSTKICVYAVCICPFYMVVGNNGLTLQTLLNGGLMPHILRDLIFGSKLLEMVINSMQKIKSMTQYQTMLTASNITPSYISFASSHLNDIYSKHST